MNVELPILFTVAEDPSFRLMKVVPPMLLAIPDLAGFDSLMNALPPIRFTVEDEPSDLLVNVVSPILLLVDEPLGPLQKRVPPMVLQVVCAVAMQHVVTKATAKYFENFIWNSFVDLGGC
jgi:hypothetical protein